MLQPPDNSQKSLSQSPTSTSSFNSAKTVSSPTEQATIGRSLVIKGEVSGSESLYIDGRIEGSITLGDNRVTIGRNGSVAANIAAREVVIMGKVQGNIQCSDRLDIRSEGTVTGDVITPRISVEDGAILKGSVQVKTADAGKHQNQSKPAESAKFEQKSLAATAGA